jgi:D-serine deaminase-like pyridoxal phosphate-dependent protein
MKELASRTPCLILDAHRMERNIARLRGRLGTHRVPLRPHLKTAKSVEIARLVMPTPTGPATVSTLHEAEAFAAAGVRDMLYAVGIAPGKLERVVALRRRAVDLAIVLDSLAQAEAVVTTGRKLRERIPVLIEIDSDGHRSGVRPADPALVEIGRHLVEGGAELRGIMTHAGASYDRPGVEAMAAAAEAERIAAVTSAAALRSAGLPCPVVSVGSTPTAHFARDLTGVTEVRVGVFVFFDLVMAGLGVCAIDDIALSVLTTVIGHQPTKGWILVDAGWMAVSRDRGTARQAVDQGYGVVCDLEGKPYPGLVLASTSQEHGILSMREGSGAALPQLPVGTLVRVLPNHACATAAQHMHYHVVRDGRVVDRWERISAGW